jgi:hypothetical protein
MRSGIKNFVMTAYCRRILASMGRHNSVFHLQIEERVGFTWLG